MHSKLNKWLFALAMLGAWVQPAHAAETAPGVAPLAASNGYEGRISLADRLDEPRGYCLDVPGPIFNIMLHIPVWAHNCHQGPGADQVFRFNVGGSGQLRWVHEEHDLCLTARESRKGARFSFEECSSAMRQRFNLSDTGALQLEATSLCIAVEIPIGGRGYVAEPGHEKFGRGRSFPQDPSARIRFLELQPCDTTPSALTVFGAHTE